MMAVFGANRWFLSGSCIQIDTGIKAKTPILEKVVMITVRKVTQNAVKFERENFPCCLVKYGPEATQQEIDQF